VPHLHSIHEAVTQDRRVNIRYQRADGTVRERAVSPYGLVAKSGIWYLIAAIEDDMRVYRVARIQDLEILAERFERPDDFDLAAFWTESYRRFETSLLQYPVTMRIAPEALPDLYLLWGDWLQAAVEAAPSCGPGEWPEVTVPFERKELAFREIFAFAAQIEIIAPAELRDFILGTAQAILQVYGQAG
jgi:predicted DNA-binding transcriptional regulator YafY